VCTHLLQSPHPPPQISRSGNRQVKPPAQGHTAGKRIPASHISTTDIRTRSFFLWDCPAHHRLFNNVPPLPTRYWLYPPDQTSLQTLPTSSKGSFMPWKTTIQHKTPSRAWSQHADAVHRGHLCVSSPRGPEGSVSLVISSHQPGTAPRQRPRGDMEEADTSQVRACPTQSLTYPSCFGIFHSCPSSV
jgi:hypothetical protein